PASPVTVSMRYLRVTCSPAIVGRTGPAIGPGVPAVANRHRPPRAASARFAWPTSAGSAGGTTMLTKAPASGRSPITTSGRPSPGPAAPLPARRAPRPRTVLPRPHAGPRLGRAEPPATRAIVDHRPAARRARAPVRPPTNPGRVAAARSIPSIRVPPGRDQRRARGYAALRPRRRPHGGRYVHATSRDPGAIQGREQRVRCPRSRHAIREHEPEAIG